MKQLTEAQQRMLDFLSRHPDSTATTCGSWVFETNKSRMPQAYARPAGAMLHKLKSMGLVVQSYNSFHKKFVWRLTAAGRDLASSPSPSGSGAGS